MSRNKSRYEDMTKKAYLKHKDGSLPILKWKGFGSKKRVNFVAFKSEASKGFFPDLADGEGEMVFGGDSCHRYMEKWDENPTYCFWFCAIEDEIIEKMRDYKGDKPYYRLKQLLGLDPTWDNKEMWRFTLNVDDVFRPCISDKYCDVKCKKCHGSRKFKKWMGDWFKNSYSGNTIIPFTGRGYTLDWSNKHVEEAVGVQEFIIKPGTRAYINEIVDLNEYLLKYCN